MASGAIVVLLGDDTIPDARFLEEHLAGHERAPEDHCAIVGYIPWSAEQPVSYFMEYIVGEGGQQFAYKALGSLDKSNLPFGWFVSSNISLKRKFLVENDGFFDEDFQYAAYEDLELGYRLQKRGLRLTYRQEAVAYHLHPTTFEGFCERQQRAGRMAVVFARKHPELASGLGILNAVEQWKERSAQLPTVLRMIGELSKIDLALLDNLTVDGEVASSGLKKHLGALFGVALQSFVLKGMVEGLSSADEAGANKQLTSIVILCRNQADFTARCVQSVVQHTPEPHEIIFVDNGSTDRTPTLLAEISAKLSHAQVIRNRENLGFAAGNNQGIAAARGDLVVLLNNDVVVTEGWLAGLRRALQAHPHLGIVGPRSNYVVGPQQVAEVTYADDRELERFAKRWAASHAGDVVELAKVVGFCMAIRREVVERIGGLDPRFYPGNFEDDDYCLRARLAGFGVAMVDDVFIHHFGSRTFIGEEIAYSETMQENWTRFKAKWDLPGDLPIDQPFSVASILTRQFDAERHFIALPVLPGKPNMAAAENGRGAGETATSGRGCSEASAQERFLLSERNRAIFAAKWARELAAQSNESADPVEDRAPAA
jgi:GT2 family glycosyltransferase